jgi:DNA-directed RNA polymerase specialized sigma24 family protein
MIQHSAIDNFSAEPPTTERLAADGLLADAQAGSVEALAHLCEAARLQMIVAVRRGLPPALQAKLGASDIVQDAVVDAHRCFPQFAGRSPAEFFGWLHQWLQPQ